MRLRFHKLALKDLFIGLANPLPAFLVALCFYFSFATLSGSPFRVRDVAFFNYLADAFLHGQLNLRLMPPITHDLSFYNGQYYLYWPPMPAVILMPFIAVFGVGFSDVFFNIIIAAANSAVVTILLREVDRKKIIELDAEYRSLLVLFFTFGTVHVTLASFGTVWRTAQLLGFLLVALAYLSAIKLNGSKAFLVTGLLIACAMLTRNHLLFTGIWPAYYLISKHWQDKRKLLQNILLGLLPVLILGALFLAYNQARFGNPFELGIQYHKMAAFFFEDYQKYGAFNLHYLPINFYYQYIFYPLPITNETAMGGSLFLLSPLFFYAFRALFRGYREPSTLVWLISILFTSIPILLLMGTGWVQYGPRYTLDFTIPLLLLTAQGIQGARRHWLIPLTILSILQYLPGIFFIAYLQQ